MYIYLLYGKILREMCKMALDESLTENFQQMSKNSNNRKIMFNLCSSIANDLAYYEKKKLYTIFSLSAFPHLLPNRKAILRKRQKKT